jgi:hypothetical protein
MRTVTVSALLLASSLPAARADIIGTGPGYASTAQYQAICLLYNAGSTAVTVTSVQIIREYTGPVALKATCNGRTILPGNDCGATADTATNVAYACKAVISSKTNVRGTFELADFNYLPIYSEPLR